MNKEEIKDVVQSFLPEAQITTETQFVEVVVPKEQLLEMARKLKESEKTAFNYLFCESAVDYNDHFMMVYHLDSTQHRHQLVLKTRIDDREEPSVDSVCEVWIGAEYHEREIFDLFGIHFNNHPDLRKIFLENDWVGFPMRRDYKDPINMIER